MFKIILFIITVLYASLPCMTPSSTHYEALSNQLRRQSPDRQRALLAALSPEVIRAIAPGYCATPTQADSLEEAEVKKEVRETTHVIRLIQTMTNYLREHNQAEVDLLLRAMKPDSLGFLMKRLEADPTVTVGIDSTVHRTADNEGISRLDPDYAEQVRLRQRLLEITTIHISGRL